jgi:hypothetical protein
MFLQFEQFDGNMADIKQVDTPPPLNQTDWEDQPVPPQIVAHQLLFLYYHPKSTRSGKFFLGKIPTRADLLANQGPKSEISYGLLLVDSWSGAKQAWSLALLLITNLLVFGAIMSVRGLLRSFSHIDQYSDVNGVPIALVDLGNTLLISSFTLLFFTTLGYTNLGFISSQFPWVRMIIRYVTLCFTFQSRKATRSGDSQPGTQTAKRIEWVNVSRMKSIKILEG